MSILCCEVNELRFPKLDMDNTGRKNIYRSISLMNVDDKIVMEEKNISLSIDAENAFDNSKRFCDVSLHKLGIK